MYLKFKEILLSMFKIAKPSLYFVLIELLSLWFYILLMVFICVYAANIVSNFKQTKTFEVI